MSGRPSEWISEGPLGVEGNAPVAMAARPLVQVADSQNGETVPLPDVFATPLRADLVRGVHDEVAKNKRQPYAVNYLAGHQTAAESWGTGRAVSRIPRVPGGGTHRAGQGAFGNMCRGGHMFSPTKTWRRWHRRVNLKQRRYATSAAVAATGVPALLMARGHKVESVPEVPLVVSGQIERAGRTKEALEILRKVGAGEEVDKVKGSTNLRRGKGKMRNRRYVSRKGPLIVYSKDDGLTKAFRNIPGVELRRVDQLNILQLAPGGHVGRFVIWTEPAFKQLDSVFGGFDKQSEQKKGWQLPNGIMQTPDLHRLINSDEIQSVVRMPHQGSNPRPKRSNPLRNHDKLLQLNPYKAQEKKEAQQAQAAPRSKAMKRRNKHERSQESRKAGRRLYKRMTEDSDYSGDYFDGFQVWIGNQAKKTGATDEDLDESEME